MGEPLTKVVAKNIKSIRVAKGINQEQLAKKVGLTRGSISNMEIGNQSISIDNLEKIAIGLNVEVTKLFDNSDIPLKDMETEYQQLKNKYVKLLKSLRYLTNEFDDLDE